MKILHDISVDSYLSSVSEISTIDKPNKIYESSQQWLDFFVASPFIRTAYD